MEALIIEMPKRLCDLKPFALVGPKILPPVVEGSEMTDSEMYYRQLAYPISSEALELVQQTEYNATQVPTQV